jgi:23S rRNA pseudouridine955/2504/2580 synthase
VNDEVKVYHNFDLENKTVPELKITFKNVYEDENILIIDKPSGVETIGDEQSIAQQVISYFKGKLGTFTPAPIHRLDRNTSGLLIVCKNITASQILSRALKERKGITKKYLTVVLGVTKSSDTIQSTLLKDEELNKVFPDRDGQIAITKYVTIKQNNKYSELEVELLTGRTHQIRVHLAQEGFPILGDGKYGDFSINRYLKKEFHFFNQFLHAFQLSFHDLPAPLDYLNNKKFKSPLPKDLQDLLNKLL